MRRRSGAITGRPRPSGSRSSSGSGRVPEVHGLERPGALTADEVSRLLRPTETLVALFPPRRRSGCSSPRVATCPSPHPGDRAASWTSEGARFAPAWSRWTAPPALRHGGVCSALRGSPRPVHEPARRGQALIAVPHGPLLSLPLGLLVTRPPAAPVADDYRQSPGSRGRWRSACCRRCPRCASCATRPAAPPPPGRSSASATPFSRVRPADTRRGRRFRPLP